MQVLARSMRIQRSPKFVLAAGLLGLAMVSGGCFRSSLLHKSGCSEADPNCQTATGKNRDAGSDGLR
ncbi:MAG: hypothetical protein WBP56_12025, partial [Polyangia bacterium]